MGKVIQFRDALVSFVNNLGIPGRDKAASTGYVPSIYTEGELAAMYRDSWLARKIIDIPAFDAFRKWREWHAEEDQITKIEDEEKRLNIRNKLLKAYITGRLYGGSAVMIGVGDPNPELPLEVERVTTGGLQYVTVMLRRHLNPGELDFDPASPYYGTPAYYELALPGLAQQAPGMQNGVRIHPSRLVLFRGAELPDDELLVSLAGRGWGDSVLVALLNAIKNSDATAANIASLVFEAKVDIVKVPDLMASLADVNYERRLLDRFALANTAKGVASTLILDKEEEWDSKTTSFAQLPEVLMAFLQLVSGGADIPITRLLGQSPAGMNSTGESDMRNYYDRVSSIQQLEITPAMRNLDECLIRSALGSRPPELYYTWSSLWQMSDKEKAEIGKMAAETITSLNNTGLFPPEGLANAAINMLTELGTMPGLDQAIEEAGGLPDFEAEAEAELELERERMAAQAAGRQQRIAANDLAPQTMYVSRAVVNKDEIRRWARSQGFETVQDDLHVTIIHTRTPTDWMKMGTDWGENADGELTIRAGGPRAVERFGEAVVLSFASTDLSWRHEMLKERAQADTDFPDFQPHITITWQAPDGLDLDSITPYRGKIVLGPEIFERVDDGWREGRKES